MGYRRAMIRLFIPLFLSTLLSFFLFLESVIHSGDGRSVGRTGLAVQGLGDGAYLFYIHDEMAGFWNYRARACIFDLGWGMGGFSRVRVVDGKAIHGFFGICIFFSF